MRMLLVMTAFLLLAEAAAAGPVPGRTGYGSGIAPGAGTCSAPALGFERPVVLPADDAAHPRDVRNHWEWWFWTAHVHTADGHRFAFALAFESKPQMRLQETFGSVSDLTAGRFRYLRAISTGVPAARENGYAFAAAGASVIGGGGRDRLRIALPGLSLGARLREIRAPVLEFGDGSTTLYCNSAFYYHRTRLAVRGTITTAGVRRRITGLAWFDHSWGFDPAYVAARSEYFQLQLRDGRDVFVGDVHAPPAGPADLAELKFGAITDSSGQVTSLHPGDLSLRPTGWFRPVPSCAYPVDWLLTVRGRRYHLHPALRNAEVRSTTAPAANALWPEDAAFWDGAATVGGAGSGQGWIDLVRYCPGR